VPMKSCDPDLEATVRRSKDGGLGQRRNTEGDRVGDNRDNKTSWKSGCFTAAQLQCMQFAPITWIVSNIIPAEGVTLLSSKPKFGKSWLAYDLCIACTMDRFTLGTIKPAQGDVLYLALEDSKRRLQRRMKKLLPTFGATWPDRLKLKTEWRRLHEGGLDDIRAWHSDTKAEGGKPILVVIDVLAKVRKPVGNRPLYEADYAALADLTLHETDGDAGQKHAAAFSECMALWLLLHPPVQRAGLCAQCHKPLHLPMSTVDGAPLRLDGCWTHFGCARFFLHRRWDEAKAGLQRLGIAAGSI
jgi:AAA domain-containing protein